MAELTKEWLQHTIAELEEERDATPGAVNEDAAKALAAMKLALASLEAKPVAEVCEGFTLRYIGHGPAPKSGVRIGDRLYADPPAPVVPDEKPMPNPLKMYAVDAVAAIAEVRGWNACRAAMLQGAEPVTTAYKLPEPIKDNRLNSGPEADDYYSGYQAGWNELLEAVSGNSPVIPDGWVLVPIEPTYQMCEAMGLPWESPRFPDRYKAMIAAAPQQEVK